MSARAYSCEHIHAHERERERVTGRHRQTDKSADGTNYEAYFTAAWNNFWNGTCLDLKVLQSTWFHIIHGPFLFVFNLYYCIFDGDSILIS